jgi:diguanylate cyclase (GGDEF)-like protein
VAWTCESTLRGTDFVARLGGDEFAVLLPGATSTDAEAVAHRLRQAIESQRVAGRHLRVSIGTATSGHGPMTASELLAAADADLYRDKRARKAATCRPAA